MKLVIDQVFRQTGMITALHHSFECALFQRGLLIAMLTQLSIHQDIFQFIKGNIDGTSKPLHALNDLSSVYT